MLAKWIAHATVDLNLSCFMLVLPQETRRESSMCDPFCKHPAFLAKAILTLLPEPQVFEQGPQDPHGPQLFQRQSTELNHILFGLYLSFYNGNAYLTMLELTLISYSAHILTTILLLF